MKVLILLSLVSVSLALPEQPIGKSERIIGGSEAEIGAHPYLVTIGWLDNIEVCAGSIVGHKKIVTAAHCMNKYAVNEMYIIAGDHNITGVELHEQIVPITSAVLHPDFYEPEDPYNSTIPKVVENDYAVLTLAWPLVWTNYVKPIELSVEGDVPSGNCVASGWGRINDTGRPDYSDVVQTIELSVVSRSDCAQQYEGAANITENMLCASAAPGKGGLCTRDSGGPLVCGNVLTGIVSWLPNVCTFEYPTVLSNIAAARSWLDAEIIQD